VSEREKKYKPLLEAIISKTDGLDILAEITGEKAPEEKKLEERREAAPTDTFGGMLQTLPMLVMLPAIMPLIQQMLTQTLAASTINVKVESATTILPIEISASTAIVPIEIKASAVTLNVNIMGSAVTLNVNVTNTSLNVNATIVQSDVTLNVKITNTSLNVNATIVQSNVTLDVNVTNTKLAVDANITNSVLNVNATIVQSNVTLDVNVTNTILNVNATIVQSNVTLDVNVTNTNLNVNATIVDSVVNINVVIKDATVDLKIYTPSGRWVVASDLLPKFTGSQAVALPAATETTVKNVTGRGRLRTLSFLVYDVGTPFDIANKIKIRIYVDGSLRFETSLIGVDSISGYPADYLRQAMLYAIAKGIALPFNTAKFGESPDRYIIMPPHTSPLGGLTMMIWDQTNSKIRAMAGYINLGMEFTSSLSIRIYNSDASYSAYAVVSYDIGEYL